MALNIESAKIGFDSNNLQSTLNHIQNNCVNNAKSALKRSMDVLRTSVDACWVGQSAETFKDNMQKDMEKVCADLDLAYEALKGVFNGVQNDFAELDESLIQAR